MPKECWVDEEEVGKVDLDGPVQMLEVDWEKLGWSSCTIFKLFQIHSTRHIVILFFNPTVINNMSIFRINIHLILSNCKTFEPVIPIHSSLLSLH